MAVTITVDQLGSGAPAGIPGQAREDLAVGFPVQLTANGGPFLAQQWSIIDKPVDIVAGTQSAALLTTPGAGVTLFQPIDQAGTYLVEVLVDSGQGLGANPEDQARITFYAGPTLNALNSDPAELPRREMAFRETTEHNVPDLVFPGGNPRGWAEERLRWQELLKLIYLGKSWAWGRIAVSPGGPAVITSGLNAGVLWVSPGVVQVLFLKPLPNANYAVIPTARGSGGSCYADNETINGFTLHRADSFGVLADADIAFDVKALP